MKKITNNQERESNKNLNEIANKTPFQIIENNNLIKKNTIKKKIDKINNEKFDFNINSHLIKNVNINNVHNIEKEIIQSINNSQNINDKTNAENKGLVLL